MVVAGVAAAGVAAGPSGRRRRDLRGLPGPGTGAIALGLSLGAAALDLCVDFALPRSEGGSESSLRGVKRSSSSVAGRYRRLARRRTGGGDSEGDASTMGGGRAGL